MSSNLLINDIATFITRLGVVLEEQIFQMFTGKGEHNPETVNWCMKSLISKCSINYDFDTHVAMRRQNVSDTDFKQNLLTEAVWILAHMGEEQVRDYWPMEYPNQLLIVTKDDTVYDITVFTYQTLDSVRVTSRMRRDALVPEGMDDITIHIALIPDRKMADKIKGWGFDSYCILDSNNVPQYYEWED